jgi:primosomal protein N' (replication factor Y)
LALVRAEGKDLTQAEAFLAELRQRSEAAGQTQCFGPLPAPMARRAGYFRAQLLVQAANRSQLNRRVSAICQQAERHRLAQKLRWSIDVDPSDMF